MITLFISLTICLVLAPAMGAAAKNLSIVSGKIAARWSHSPKPLLGGMTLSIAAFAAIRLHGVPASEFPILLTTGLFTIVGICDDVIRLTPHKKFILQIIAAIISVKWFLLIPLSPSFLILVLWIVFVTNAFNLIDGIDGLAVSYAVLIFSWMIILGTGHIFTYSVLGVCIGFFLYNIRPASLYLGDSGSHFLGSAIALLTLPSNALGGIGIGSWQITDLLPLFYPLCDIIFVSITRRSRGISITVGGTDHIAHRMSRVFGENKTVSLLLLLTFTGIALSLLLRKMPPFEEAMIFTSAVTLGVFLLWMLNKRTKSYFINRTSA